MSSAEIPRVLSLKKKKRKKENELQIHILILAFPLNHRFQKRGVKVNEARTKLHIFSTNSQYFHHCVHA